MMEDNQISGEAWLTHLSSEGVPSVHLAETSTCDLAALLRAGAELGFIAFHIDGQRIRTKDDLMDEIAARLQFPPYFGRNWDAVSDLLRDLSWAPATGYVIIVTTADDLLRVGHQDFGDFIGVVECAIRDWRDERGEYNERTGPVAFHLVLCGTRDFSRKVAPLLKEPVCEHRSG